MAKYVIEIPDERIGDFVGSTHLLMPYTMAGHQGSHDTGLELTPYIEPDQKVVEDEVWEFARNLLNYTNDDWDTIENMLLVDKCSYQEAKAKYDAWKVECEQIHVGDEVFHKDYPNDKVVVTRLYQSGFLCADILFSSGEIDEEIMVDKLIKTGRHFPEVAELLKKMREE